MLMRTVAFLLVRRILGLTRGRSTIFSTMLWQRQAAPGAMHEVDAAQLTFIDLVDHWRTRRLTELGVAGAVDQILAKVMYSGEVIRLPLGKLHGLDDEWGTDWGWRSAATAGRYTMGITTRCFTTRSFILMYKAARSTGSSAASAA